MFTQQRQIPRSPYASTITLIVHGAVGVLVWAMTAAVANLPSARERLTYVVMMSPPAVPVVFPSTRSPKPTPPPRPEPPKVIDLPVVTPPAPLTERVAEPLAPPPPKVEAPAPKVVVGAFAERIEAAARRLPAHEVQATGFEKSASQIQTSRRYVGEVGGFDLAEGGNAARSATTRAVATGDAGFAADRTRVAQRTGPQANVDSGFASAPAPATRRAEPRTSDSSGFGVNAPGAAPQTSAPREVAATGFADAAPPPRTASRVAAPQHVDRSVEVTYKPQPQYTDEARQLRIEGEVLLEVEFTAEGLVRVLRVARGLGHGLDDMACRAVQQIRFNPALRNGVPVTSRTSVNIVFRLT
jgi:TonB family protein